MPVSTPLATLLADRRTALNAKVASARTRNPAFDTQAFSAFIAGPFDQLLGAVLAARPDGGAAFVDTGFDMVIALVEHGWAGDRDHSGVVRRVWTDLAPRLAVQIAANPRETLGALSNSAIKLAGEPGVRIDDWLNRLTLLGPHTGSPAQLRHLAAMAAWRSGAAHLRDAALALPLSPEIASVAVGARRDADWGELVNAFKANRWWTPDRSAPADGYRIGAFTGLGGRFPEPTKLAVLGDAFILSSAGQYFVLDADAYGAGLRMIDAVRGAAATPATLATMANGRQIRADDRLVSCRWPQDGLAVAMTSDTVAVVSAWSHQVQVFARALP